MKKRHPLELTKRDRNTLYRARVILQSISSVSRSLAEENGDALIAAVAPIADQIDRNINEFEIYLQHIQDATLAENYRSGKIQYEPDLPF